MALQLGYSSRRAHFSTDPGRLDRRVSLQYPIGSRDAVGGSTSAWFEVAEVWASKRALSGARLFAAEMKNSADLTVFRIRHRNDVTSFWRLVHGDDVYEIVPPVEELGRRHFLDLTCRAINQSVGSQWMTVNVVLSDTSLRFRFKDPTVNRAINLTTLTAALFLVKSAPNIADSAALFTKSLGTGMTVIDPTGAGNGGLESVLDVFPTPTDLAALTSPQPWFFELRLTFSGGTASTYARGLLTRRPPP